MYLSEEQLEEAAVAVARGAVPKRLLDKYTAELAPQHPDVNEKKLRRGISLELRSVRKGDSRYTATKYDPIYDQVEAQMRAEYSAIYRAARNITMQFLQKELARLQKELDDIDEAQKTADIGELDYAQLTALRLKVADKHLEIAKELGQYSGALRFDLDRLKEVG